MAAKTVKLPEEVLAVAREEARVSKRTIAGQVFYWVELGRSFEALMVARVSPLMRAKNRNAVRRGKKKASANEPPASEVKELVEEAVRSREIQAALARGKAALENAHRAMSVRAVLSGRGSVQTLTPAETEMYLSFLGTSLESLDGSDTQRIRELEQAGHPIAGETEEGKLMVRRGERAAE